MLYILCYITNMLDKTLLAMHLGKKKTVRTSDGVGVFSLHKFGQYVSKPSASSVSVFMRFTSHLASREQAICTRLWIISA